MLTSAKCKYKHHYRCTKLPTFQLANFLSSTYRKTFVCESCNDVPDILREQCKGTEWDDTNSAVASKMEIIKSMDATHITLQELMKDKDEIIASQKAIIDGIQKNTRYNLISIMRIR